MNVDRGVQVLGYVRYEACRAAHGEARDAAAFTPQESALVLLDIVETQGVPYDCYRRVGGGRHDLLDRDVHPNRS